METLSELTDKDPGSYEVRTMNTTYLIENVSEGESWATRFAHAGELRKDGERLRVLWLKARKHGTMTMLLDGVADSGAQTVRGPTSLVLDIIKVE